MTNEQLKELLDMLDINPSQAHKIIPVSRQTIFRWLNGERSISPAHEVAIYASLLEYGGLRQKVQVIQRYFDKQGKKIPQWNRLKNDLIFFLNSLDRVKKMRGLDT